MEQIVRRNYFLGCARLRKTAWDSANCNEEVQAAPEEKASRTLFVGRKISFQGRQSVNDDRSGWSIIALIPPPFGPRLYSVTTPE